MSDDFVNAAGIIPDDVATTDDDDFDPDAVDSDDFLDDAAEEGLLSAGEGEDEEDGQYFDTGDE